MHLVYVMHKIVTHFGYDCFITTKLNGSITLSLISNRIGKKLSMLILTEVNNS